CLSFEFGEGGLGSQYMSRAECLGIDPSTGHIGYVNGMGMRNLVNAGRDMVWMSDNLCDGNNLHYVYHSTHVDERFVGRDYRGLVKDVLRMAAVNGGSYTKTSYLVAQQWIDYLDSNPSKNYLRLLHLSGQVLNFVKLEDKLINPWGMNTHQIGKCPRIVIVPHHTQQDNPHNKSSQDFKSIVRPYIQRFMLDGNLYDPNQVQCGRMRPNEAN
ncbi:hypothetical protein SAMD00019534_094120, partial [Acytostelium subglobosum LB1]|uniref:hypothetical protein n=1 Tax=Acytostelium subglobosum LB1 TaxID=1410327 RepID=UPI0006449025